MGLVGITLWRWCLVPRWFCD